MPSIHPPTGADRYSILLKKIADELLSGGTEDNKLNAAAQLYSLCSSLSGLDEHSDHPNDSEGIRLPNGEAISPKAAARCVLDSARTSKFLKGLSGAVLEAQKRFPGATIEILYPGCGPFAPLAIALTARFSSTEIQFTLLDVHQRSLDAAHRIFHALGKSAFVRDYLQGDATSYQHAASHVIHVVVVEAMQRALEKEPQVAITMNLVPQLCPGGIFIPESITIHCYLCDPAKEFAAFVPDLNAAASLSARGGRRIYLGPVLELTAGNCTELLTVATSDAPGPASLVPKVLKISEEVDSQFCLMLSTAVTVFDSIVLDESESGLTCPEFLFGAGKMQKGKRIELAYHLGGKPGFKYRSL